MINNYRNINYTTNEFADNTQPAVFEIDSSGTELNYYSYTFSDDREIYGMDTALDGGYVFAGRSITSTDDTNAFVLKTKSDFSTDWSTTLGNSGAEYFKDIVAADFSYIAVGTTNNRGEGLDDVYIVHLDSFGDTLLHETLGGDSIDMGFAIAKFPNMPVCYIAGYNTSYGIEETGNAYLGGVLEYNWKAFLEPRACKVARILLIDGLIFRHSKPDEQYIWQANSIIGPDAIHISRTESLFHFLTENKIDVLLLYDLDLIFNPPSTDQTLDDGIANSQLVINYKDIYLEAFIKECTERHIYCGMIDKFEGENYQKAFDYTHVKVSKNQYNHTGKLYFFTLEHEFWNNLKYPAYTASGKKHPIYWKKPASDWGLVNNEYSYWNCNDHFLAVMDDHVELLDKLHEYDEKDGNVLKRFDYIQYIWNNDFKIDCKDQNNINGTAPGDFSNKYYPEEYNYLEENSNYVLFDENAGKNRSDGVLLVYYDPYFFDVWVWDEIPTGAVNGVNKIFTTQYDYRATKTKVYLNGIKQVLGSGYYEISDNQIQFNVAPSQGSVIIIHYIKKEKESHQGLDFLTTYSNHPYPPSYYQDRIKYMGQNENEPTIIFPLFSNEYHFSSTKKCPKDNDDNDPVQFLGNYLYGLSGGDLIAVNDLYSVENEYINQHTVIYNDEQNYPDITNVHVNGMAWFSRDCFCEDFTTNDLNYFDLADAGLIDCPTYSDLGYLNLPPVDTFTIQGYKIYPNPTTGKLFIESLTNASDFNNSMIYIYNMYGSIVYSDVIHDEDNNVSIDISKLSKGLYILSIHKISGNSTFKIIIR